LTFKICKFDLEHLAFGIWILKHDLGNFTLKNLPGKIDL